MFLPCPSATVHSLHCHGQLREATLHLLAAVIGMLEGKNRWNACGLEGTCVCEGTLCLCGVERTVWGGRGGSICGPVGRGRCEKLHYKAGPSTHVMQ